MDEQKELLRGSTLTLVLAVLRDRPLHGYGIAREIERRSGQSLALREGTLYPILRDLEEDRMITGQWETTGDRPRKVYALTPAGLGALERRTRTWQQFVSAVQSVLETEGDTADEDAPRERKRPAGRLRPEPAG